MSAGERTEAATPRRLQKLREQGRVVRSADLNTALGVIVSFWVVQQLGGTAVTRLQDFLRNRLAGLAQLDLAEGVGADLGYEALLVLLAVMAPLFLALPVVGVVANLAQVGFTLSDHALSPDLNRVNPLSGLQRLFSLRSLVELGTSSVKIAVLGYVVYQAYLDNVPALLALGSNSLSASVPSLVSLALSLGIHVGVALLALAAIDYGYQRWQFQRDAQMTKEELKQEFKESEGSPELKSRMRQRQRKLAAGRMIADVPKADVVVTNPTHLAVAIAYRSGEMAAPQVLAKGGDLVAERIKAMARTHGVPILENKPLARALFRSVEVGAYIPPDLFQAVAEVLAWVYGLRQRKGNAYGSRARD